MKKVISVLAVLVTAFLLSSAVLAIIPPSELVSYRPVYIQEVDQNGIIWPLAPDQRPSGWIKTSGNETDLVRIANRFLVESKLGDKYQLPWLAAAYVRTAKVKLPVAYAPIVSTADNGVVNLEYDAVYIGAEKKPELKPIETTVPTTQATKVPDQKRTDAVAAPKLPATGATDVTVALLAAVALIGVGLFTFRRA